METSLNLHCPGCGAAIVPRLGCCGCCVTRAVQLQADRFGTELLCPGCGSLYVVLRTDASRDRSSSIGHHPHRADMDDWQSESFDEPEDHSTAIEN